MDEKEIVAEIEKLVVELPEGPTKASLNLVLAIHGLGEELALSFLTQSMPFALRLLATLTEEIERRD